MKNVTNRSFIAHPMGKWGLFLLALFALWFGGWFAFASYADGKLSQFIEGIHKNGTTVDCTNRDMRGFPFRIGIHCDTLLVDRPSDLFSIELGAVQTTAQLYAPGEMIAEVSGPLKSLSNGVELAGNWSAMRLFLDARLTNGFDLASLTFSDVSLALGEIALKVADGALHIRPTPPNELNTTELTSLDGAVRLTTLAAILPELTVPDATVEADATLLDGYQDLIVDQRPIQSVLRDGAALNIRNLALTLPNGGRLAISGLVEMDPTGLLSGTITIGVNDPNAVSQWAGQIDPGLAQSISLVAQAIAGMGKSTRIGNADMKAIVLDIDKGYVSLGFLKLPDQIPPLPIN